MELTLARRAREVKEAKTCIIPDHCSAMTLTLVLYQDNTLEARRSNRRDSSTIAQHLRSYHAQSYGARRRCSSNRDTKSGKSCKSANRKRAGSKWAGGWSQEKVQGCGNLLVSIPGSNEAFKRSEIICRRWCLMTDVVCACACACACV